MEITIPLLDLKEQYQTIKDDVAVAVNRVLESQKFILGSEVEQFEKEICDYCSCKYAIGVSSGSDALLIALMALNIGPGDEVITTSYSFFATVGAIVRLGARPVFTDIDLNSYNIDVDQLDSLISPKTKAIIPVHLFGQVAEMDKIKEISEKHHLKIIEDSAQSLGAIYHGCAAGTIGDLGCYSFFPSKNLGGIGDGGMVVTNDESLADKIKILRSHGALPKYTHIEIGGNFRLDEIQAAVLRVKLKYLEEWTELRRYNAKLYRELFSNKLSSYLESAAIILPEELRRRRHVYNQYVIRCNDRNLLYNHLRQNGIGCEIYYPITLPEQPCLSYLNNNLTYYRSKQASDKSLAIPIYPELGSQRLTKIVETISDFFTRKGSRK